MRVVEEATVLWLGRAGQAGGASLGSKVGLTQATSFDEDLDWWVLLATTRDGCLRRLRCAAGTY